MHEQHTSAPAYSFCSAYHTGEIARHPTALRSTRATTSLSSAKPMRRRRLHDAHATQTVLANSASSPSPPSRPHASPPIYLSLLLPRLARLEEGLPLLLLLNVYTVAGVRLANRAMREDKQATNNKIKRKEGSIISLHRRNRHFTSAARKTLMPRQL